MAGYRDHQQDRNKTEPKPMTFWRSQLVKQTDNFETTLDLRNLDLVVVGSKQIF